MKKTILYFWFIFFLSQSVFADTSLAELNLPQVAPTKTDYYEVDSHVGEGSAPGFLKFKVSSPHHVYEVEGIDELFKLFHEIEVIERVKRNDIGGFVSGAANSVVGTGKGFFKLVTHPVQSAKGLGQAAGKLSSKIGNVFGSSDKGEETSFSEKVYGKAEREIANKYQVDVYTENPFLKDLIQRMATSRSMGGGAVAIASFFIPAGLIGNIVLTTSNTNQFADQLVNDTDRSDLFESNQDALIKLGFGLYDIKNFLNHPLYTPRGVTYMRFYLEKLKDVEGFRKILKRAITAENPPQVRKVLREAQMAADHVNSESPYEELKYFDEGIALKKNNEILFITGYDYLDAGSLGERIVNRVLLVKSMWNKSAIQIWNSGKMTERFVVLLRSNGITAREWVLFESLEKEKGK